MKGDGQVAELQKILTIRRKQGKYKLFKLPIGSIFIPNGNKTIIRLNSSGAAVEELFKIESNEYLVVNCDKNLVYKDTLNNILDLYEGANGDSLLELIKRNGNHVAYAFGTHYYDRTASDFVLNGIDIRIKKDRCSIFNIVLDINNYGKYYALVNKEKYDIERFLAEFDNRSVPKQVRDSIKSEINYAEGLSGILNSGIKDLKNLNGIMILIKQYVDKVYPTSVLRYYNISNIEVDNKEIVFNECTEYRFDVRLKSNNQLALYLNDRAIIGYRKLNEFFESFINIFALYNARKIYSLIPSHLSLCAIELIKDYKHSSSDFKRNIQKAFNGEEIKSYEIEYYIKAIYLYKLLNKCKSRTDISLFRGGINGDRIYEFKSASFILPVALDFGKTLDNVANIICPKGSSIMLSNSTGEYGHEAEVIINAGWRLEEFGSKNRLKIIKDDEKDLEIKDSLIADIVNGILYDDVLKNYLYVGNVIDGRIDILWMYSEENKMRVVLNKDGFTLQANIGEMKFTENDLDKFLSILRRYVKKCILDGMVYRKYCDLHRIIAMGVQSIFVNMGFVMNVKCLNDKSFLSNILMIGETDKEILIKDQSGKMLFSKTKIEVNTDSLIDNCCWYIVKNYKLNYLGYVGNMLNEYAGYRDKLRVTKNGVEYDITNYNKGIRIKNLKNKKHLDVEFTFNEVTDATRLYKIFNNDADMMKYWKS